LGVWFGHEVAGLAVIAGSSNFVSPQATADALIPAINCFAAWYVLALVAVLFIGFETRGRTIDEIDSAPTATEWRFYARTRSPGMRWKASLLYERARPSDLSSVATFANTKAAITRSASVHALGSDASWCALLAA
jgi:hypothetical protein